VVSIDEIERQVLLLLDEFENTKMGIENNKLQIALSSTLRLLDGSETKTLDALHGTSDNLKSYLISMVSEIKNETTNRLLSLEQHTREISQHLSAINRKH
jgi:hypothetical protein